MDEREKAMREKTLADVKRVMLAAVERWREQGESDMRSVRAFVQFLSVEDLDDDA